MIDVMWLPPSGLDQFMIRDLLSNVLWNPVGAYEFRHVEDFAEVRGDGAVLVLPGGYNEATAINDMIAPLKWVLVIIVSDENNQFPTDELKHPNMKLWVQYPRTGRDYGNARFIGAGYAEAPKFFPEDPTIINDIFLSAQDTHERRHKMFDAVEQYAEEHPDLVVDVIRTRGFTQGIKPIDYYEFMRTTKIAPAPSGTTTPDSFRVYEALECGAIPIADDLSPRYDSKGYWARLFPDTPMPILGDDDIAAIISTELANYPQRRNQIFAWWQQQKRQYAYDLVEDLNYLTGNTASSYESLKDRVTVVVPVSPWKSHPDTAKLEETITNVRAHLPESEIIVTFDGVREEQMDRYDDYQEFVIRMLHKMNNEYTNVLPIVFTEHSHQAKMAHDAMQHVKTRSILYNEGDSPLYPSREIEWDALLDAIETARANVIRLYNKEEIPPEHDYLMHHEHDIPGLSLVGTSQWSQQPHIADSNFYRQILDFSTGYFTENAKCFIEERMYYIIVAESRNGQWEKWRMFIYKPDNLPRSYHVDGREGESNFYESQTY
jgi:hypothetical protein